MPTTHELGPNGSFNEVATRFGVGVTKSRENRLSDEVSRIPDNTTIRLADAVNLFDTGALAPGVMLEEANYAMIAVDAGMKYRGVFVGAAYFQRWLFNFAADGPLPVSSIVDRGFYLQAAFYPVKQLPDSTLSTSISAARTGTSPARATSGSTHSSSGSIVRPSAARSATTSVAKRA